MVVSSLQTLRQPVRHADLFMSYVLSNLIRIETFAPPRVEPDDEPYRAIMPTAGGFMKSAKKFRGIDLLDGLKSYTDRFSLNVGFSEQPTVRPMSLFKSHELTRFTVTDCPQNLTDRVGLSTPESDTSRIKRIIEPNHNKVRSYPLRRSRLPDLSQQHSTQPSEQSNTHASD